MTYIVVIGLIYIYAISLVFVLNKRIEQTIPISVVIIILIIYLCGIFDNLILGINIVKIVSLIQVVAIFVYCIFRKNEVKEKVKKILTPGALVYIAICGIFIFSNKDRILENYDEFNHWGKIVKSMFLNNSYMANEQSTITFNEYPPFTAIFQYLFLTIKGVYREDLIITANCILYWSLVIPITRNIDWGKTMLKLIFVLPTVIFVPMIFYNNFYIEILTDGILGIAFGMCIFYAYQTEESNVFKGINIFTMLIILALTKTSGIALAVLATLIILMEIIINYKGKERIVKIARILLIASIVLALTIMWYVKVKDTTKEWNFSNYMKNEAVQTKRVDENFTKTIFTLQCITDKKVTVFNSVLLIICSGIFLNQNIKRHKPERSTLYIWMMVNSILIYMTFLYMTYSRIFTTIEADTLDSFGRYSSTILLANVFFQIIVWYDLEENIGWKKALLIIVMLLCFLPQENIEEKYINKNKYVATSKVKRDAYTKINKYANQLNTDDKVLYITGYNVDIEYLELINNYEIMPIRITKITTGAFSDKKYFESIAEKYDYIYIYRINKSDLEIIKAQSQNGIIKNDTLYKIVTQKEQVSLEEIKN